MSDLIIWDGEEGAAIPLWLSYLEEWAHNVDLRASAAEYAYRDGEPGLDFIDELTEEAFDAVEERGLDGEAPYDDGDPNWPR